VQLAGICATDLELARGYMGFEGIPGHEFVGVIERSADAASVGKRVVGEINAACGHCDRCLAGAERHCAQRTVLGIAGRDGAFAEYLTLPQHNLHTVPEGVADRAAVFTEPLAAALRILEQSRIDGDARIVVLGDGKLGLLVAAVMVHAGAHTTVVGRHTDSLAIARGWGASVFLDESFSPDRSADVVVDATGNADALSRALAAVRPLGTVVLKTTVAGRHQLDLAPVVIDEITVLGSRCGPFAPALEFLAGGFDPTPLIDGRYPLSAALTAFDRAAQPGTGKVLLSV